MQLEIGDSLAMEIGAMVTVSETTACYGKRVLELCGTYEPPEG